MRKRIRIADCLDLVSDVDKHHLEIQMPDGACCVVYLQDSTRALTNKVVDEWVNRQHGLKLAELTTAATEKVMKS